ncbi:SusC/RagA family TonB-linked outer membrane protein [Chitinophaga japonensis]|uniref:TonB-linked SusC/RagA family outer membrane protein n=1 Tax=Chitinophaga japonensis TaxID=104662 RepID=A0A562SLA1_CHIJA|nr:SusC/RagA family TonB-linked outer membrane protein [Chitinophaga japonensis]TWI82002.1 TonB-linked SusC/RagA family outer membrane protein [Chitinophaga japonensis]
MTNLLFLTRRQWRLLCLLLLTGFSAMSAAAQVRIAGKVTSQDGNGIPGITVQVKNTTYGAVTDPDGTYSFNANLQPGPYTIKFSGVGFATREQALQIGDAGTYTVITQLSEDALGLDEVVVTGTTEGTTRKQLGNYIATVKADQLTKGATGNALAALQGKTAGAQISQNSGDPAGGISVRLRGISTISGSSEPLYIVDGIIVNNATNRVTNTAGTYDGSNFIGTIGQNRMVDINPADIDHIEVLNGAAAAAIYGSRANAGVVQIFTKRGSTGAPEVNFSTNFMVSQLRKKLDVNQAPVKFGPESITQDILVTSLTETTPVKRYDYQDYIFRTGVGTDNNVSVSGGRDKTRYYASASYFYNQGIIQNTDFQRYSFRMNLDQQMTDWLSFTAGVNYVNSSANEKPDGNSFFSPMNSVTIIGNIHDIYARDAAGNLQAVGERGRVNPVSVIEDFKQKQQTSRVLANVGLKAYPVKNLTLSYNLGIDNYSQRGNTFMPPYAYNVSTAFFGGGSSLDGAQNGYASSATNNFFQINHDLSANYKWNISDHLNATTQLGYSLQYERNNYLLTQGRGLAPFVEAVNSAATPLPTADSRSEISISGVYLQQSFGYRNQLFLTGALRMDGSSVFGEDERNQLYVKASGSYVLSEAEFWKDAAVSNWWNLLKVRAAYGQSGNLTGIGAYDRFNSYTPNAFNSKTSFAGSSILANEDIAPERQQETEFGADLAFLQNRIGLQVNYYIKRVDDLLLDRVIAPTVGYSSYRNNIGSLENKGIEVVLNLVPVQSKHFRWDVTGIFNRNRNKALKIGQSLILYNTNGGAPVAILEGQPIGVFYGTFFARDANGNDIKNAAGIPQQEKGVQNGPLSYTPQRDANGLPTGTTLRKIIGDPNPDYTATLVNELSYKKFNLRVQLDAVQGNDVFNADFRTRQGVGNGKVAEQEYLGQLPRGYIAGVYATEEWRIDDGSFVKLREVYLGYNVGRIKGFRDLTVSVSGRNLVSWDNYKGYDPEVNAAGQSTVLRGIDFGAVPVPRTFSVGMSAKF